MLENKKYREINTDSRSIKQGEIFIPLRGEKYDGHDFLLEAFKKGASEAFSELNSSALLEKFGAEIREYLPRIFLVENTLKKYQELANEYRNLLNPIVIGITGSSGKTTTKELLNTVLKNRFKIHCSQANFNNEIGVPKTILSMPEDTKILILEMGMRGLGQIEELSKIAEPNMAIITNIGTAHIELLGSKENIERAKLEIISGLRPSQNLSPLLLIDEILYKKLEAENRISYYKSKISSLEIRYFDYQARFFIQGLLSRGLIADLNAVYEISKIFSLGSEEVQKSLEEYRFPNGRGDFKKDENGYLWIDSSYNANPDSLRNDLKALLEQFPSHKKLLVISRIEESDENLLKDLWQELYKLEKDPLIKLMDLRSKDIDSSRTEIRKWLAGNDPESSLVFLKASRAAGLERLL
jgi:UDP-N-acetylmuramoyl-tripeptide--D-alanyl-D-alanine ligase